MNKAPRFRRPLGGVYSLSLIISMGIAGSSIAQQFDATYLALEEKNRTKWAAEDQQIQAKLTALEKKFGKKPNIIYVLADDVGWGEMGWQGGGKHRGTPTPELDRIAGEGMRFWSAYAEPSCTPSRIAINTGRHPVRTGLLSVLWPGQTDGLSGDEVTVAEVIADLYERRLRAFQQRIDVALFGPELVEILGGDTLEGLLASGNLISFLESQEYEGTPLNGLLGGWLGASVDLRGREIVAYHKNWIYLTDLLGLHIVDYVERKPGIPPSARHVHQLVETIQGRGVEVLLAANYYSSRQIEAIAERTGVRTAVVPLGPMETDEDGYFRLVDNWVSSLAEAFSE